MIGPSAVGSTCRGSRPPARAPPGPARRCGCRRWSPPRPRPARLGARLAEDGEAVEAGIVHPDPDREPVGPELLRMRRGEVGDLLLGHPERQMDRRTARARWLRPGAGRDHQPPAAIGPPPARDLDLAVDGAERFDRRTVAAAWRRAPAPCARGPRCPAPPSRCRCRPGTARGCRRRGALRPAAHDLAPHRGARTARPPRPCCRCSWSSGMALSRGPKSSPPVLSTSCSPASRSTSAQA